MNGGLTSKTVAFLVTDGFEQAELTVPRAALLQVGARPRIISPNKDKVRGRAAGDWGDAFEIDVALDQAKVSEYDALVLPGGPMNSDKLRQDEQALEFVRGFFEEQKPVAAICHGPWVLLDAGVVHGRKLTSWSPIKADLVNAGARWVGEPVVVDDGLVTGSHQCNLDAFSAELIEQVAGAESTARHY
jgi:protease I